MPETCPCGYQPKASMKDVTWITQTILDAMSSNIGAWVLGLIDPLYGRAINLAQLCAGPPPPAVTPTISWVTDPADHLDDILSNILRYNWNQYCQCTPCAAIAGCTGTNTLSVVYSDGILDDPDYDFWIYQRPGSQTIYVHDDTNNTCYGPFTGLDLRWCLNTVACDGVNVVAYNYDGTGATGIVSHGPANHATTLYFGSGDGGAPVTSWPDGGFTVDDPPVAPTCVTTTICTALDYLYKTVTTIQRVLDDTIDGVAGIGPTTPYTLPGMSLPVVGGLAEQLRQVATYLAPITPAQLTNPVSTPITATGTMTVTNKALAVVEFASVPDWIGSRGTVAPVYYSNHRTPGPGWVLLRGEHGVVEYRELKYPDNLELIIPPMATELAVELQPGVQITVTTYQRVLPT